MDLPGLAERLSAAEANAAPIAQLSDDHPQLSVEEAYWIQLHNVRGRVTAGATVRGHKIGLTARAMQDLLGVEEPDYGYLLDDMFVSESQPIDTAALCAPRVEPEVAFVLDGPLRGPGVTAADVLRVTAFVMPSLEVIDSRIADWRIGLVDTVADNASAARVVLGGQATSLKVVDLRTLGVVVRADGDIVTTGAAGAALGNPVDAVAWLANKLADYDTELAAGHVILPGSCTTAVPVTSGTVLRTDFDVLGSVTACFR